MANDVVMRWHIRSSAAINATLQILVIYKYRLVNFNNMVKFVVHVALLVGSLSFRDFIFISKHESPDRKSFSFGVSCKAWI